MASASSICDWDKRQRQLPNSRRHCVCGQMMQMLQKISASRWPVAHKTVPHRAKIAKSPPALHPAYPLGLSFQANSRTPNLKQQEMSLLDSRQNSYISCKQILL